MKNKVKKSSRDKLLDVTFEEVYRYGYNGAGTASILKKAGVPKGSMYHHFSSKKEMVLCMIEERLIPKVRNFFDFKFQKNITGFEILQQTFIKISKNKMLITYGCPLHRLMFEMNALDKDIATVCEDEFNNLSEKLAKILAFGMRDGTIKEADSVELASYIIASSWGWLSRPIGASSSHQFLMDSRMLLKSIST
jgi:TetR/AcrR family transcriptional repressor of nem operon